MYNKQQNVYLLHKDHVSIPLPKSSNKAHNTSTYPRKQGIASYFAIPLIFCRVWSTKEYNIVGWAPGCIVYQQMPYAVCKTASIENTSVFFVFCGYIIFLVYATKYLISIYKWYDTKANWCIQQCDWWHVYASPLLYYGQLGTIESGTECMLIKRQYITGPLYEYVSGSLFKLQYRIN